MRKPADWMTFSDDRILEFLSTNHPHGPTKMADKMSEIAPGFERTRNTISLRCRRLEEHGLLEDVSRGVYAITEEGEAYLEGELDVSSLAEKQRH